MRHYRAGIRNLEDLAWQTDKGIVLASAPIEEYRQQQVLLPTLNNIERICAEAVTRATRSVYVALTRSLADVHRERLDDLLRRKESSKTTLLAWLRQSPAQPNSRHMLELSSGSELCRHSICLAESSGRFIGTACSRSPVWAVR
jgi:hypothetical protein